MGKISSFQFEKFFGILFLEANFTCDEECKFEEATAMFEKGVSVAMQNSYPFTERELATILAALRLFQEARRNTAPLSEHFEEIEPLTTSEIDALCERLNTNTN